MGSRTDIGVLGVCVFALCVDFDLGLEFISRTRAKHESNLLKVLHDGVSGLDGSESSLLDLAREFESTGKRAELTVSRALKNCFECNRLH